MRKIWKQGDKVILKSGSPVMTVHDQFAAGNDAFDDRPERVVCHWWDQHGQPHEIEYGPDEITEAPQQ